MTNKTLNTGSMSNKALGSQSITWDEATFSWDDAQGTWDNPYNLTNKALNTGSMTNKAIS